MPRREPGSASWHPAPRSQPPPTSRAATRRASVYLGSSGKLGRQLKWASDTGARWALIYGGAEDEANKVTVRDMTTGDQAQVPVGALTEYLAGLADAAE